MPLLSVVIITYNEEKNIERCLESLQGLSNDIVVVDSFSTDKTQDICNKFQVRFVQTSWKGYSENKNYGNSIAENDWILSLDADESLSPELRNSLITLKEKSDSGFYRINRITNYCGNWVRHGGWYPDIKVRLFDRKISHWEGVIHEKLNHVNEKITPVLKGDCYHYSYYTLGEHKAQANRFSTMAAEELYSKGKKASWFKIIFAPIHKFLKGYIFQLGFLDGYVGWKIATVSAHAVFLKYNKLRKLYAKK